MKTISYSDLRENLKSKLDEVSDFHEPLIITRQKGKNMVLMSLEDYNSYMETIELLSSPTNAEHLFKSKKQAEEGFTKEMTLDELKRLEK